jgi:DNA-binding IclR family transcriptional regulator
MHLRYQVEENCFARNVSFVKAIRRREMQLFSGGRKMREGGVKSARRVFEIIELFGRKKQPLRLKHIVEELHYPHSSVAALLKCMTHLGYLSFDQRKHCYSLTGRLASLTSWSVSDSFETGIVEEVLRNIQKESDELVLLGAENGIHVEYVKTYRSLGKGMQLFIAPGTKRILIQGGAGWFFLRDKAPSAIADIYRRTIKAGYITADKYPLSRLTADLEKSRDNDLIFVTAREVLRQTAHWRGGLIAMQIPVPLGHRELVICIGGAAERLKERLDTLAAILRANREKIREALDQKMDEPLSAVDAA